LPLIQIPEGKLYWISSTRKQKSSGPGNITIPTLTRPWILPDEIILRTTSTNAYIYKATLKVSLEADYLASSTNPIINSNYAFTDPA